MRARSGLWLLVVWAGAWLGLGGAAGSAAAEERFFDWTRLPVPREELVARRAALARALGASGGGVFLAPSRAGLSDGTTFRQLDDFLYFTGLELPDSVLAIEAGTGRSTLLVPRRDARFENASRPNDFPGRPLLGDPAIAEAAGIDEVLPIEELPRRLAAWTAHGEPLRVDPGTPAPVASLLGPTAPAAAPIPIRPPDPLRDFIAYLRATLPAVRIESAYAEVARLRMIKSPAEQQALRRAARLTAQAIRRAAQAVRPDAWERTLEAEFEAECKRGGAQRLAFSSIIKSGPNALWPWRILGAHYDRRNRRVRAGELVIFDVGCELDYYASDVGRTFPVSGRFTATERRLLAMEVAVADALIAAIRPGRTLAEVQAEGAARIPAEARRHMQVAGYFGHHIGLSAGDPALADLPLAPGMVLTVEPWYYDHEGGRAVFTEDVILVTEHGAENLTAELPRSPEALERLVGARRPGR